jgi:hypothetical protein
MNDFVILKREAMKHASEKKALRRTLPRHIAEDDEHLLGEMEYRSDFYPALDALVETISANRDEALSLRAQAARHVESAKSLEMQNEQIEAQILQTLLDINERIVPRPHYRLTVRQNGNHAVIITDPALIPAAYMKPPSPPEPDKIAIRKALNDSQRKAEVEAGATLSNAAPSLQITFRGNGTSS